MSDPADPRLRDLRRMRALATALLIAMLAIFVGASAAEYRWPPLAYLRAFAEAGMIGACADWFAVVALFRHPLGIPIPHTAIVPRSKERIGIAIGRFVVNNFLSPRVLAERIREIDFARWGGRWLSKPENAHSAAQRSASVVRQALRSMPRDDVNSLLTRITHYGVQAVPVSQFASQLLSLLWAHGEMQVLLDHALTRAGTALARNRDNIKQKVSQRSSRLIPKWVDGIVADKIVAGLTSVLEEMREPDHPWRVELAGSVEKLIEDLATSPEMIELGEALKVRFLENPVVTQQINSIWVAIESSLDSPSTSQRLPEAIEGVLMTIGDRLAYDEGIGDGLNRWVRVAVLRVVAPRREEISAFIRKVVENWDTETLIYRIELQVGRDLQYIRINGTLVGGLVGLTIFSLARWFSPNG
jgi:uncharacterized membrane-anchored protein YjiN (DUF445 family)